MSVKRDVVASFIGQGWVAVMGLAFVPQYIRYLGIEAYGLIGVFALLQVWLGLLDMGITPTLNREMARFSAGVHSPQSIRNLLRSLEIITVTIAAVVVVSIWSVSDYLASDWLNAKQLPASAVIQALLLIAIVVGLRFVEGIYRGALIGLQRQVWYSAVNAVLATLRNGGVVVVLIWIAPTVQAFFFWHAVVSVVSVAVFASSVYRILPDSPAAPRFSRASLDDVWKFAGGMMGINLVALLLTQVDKVLLSRLLSLELFGYYTLAATVAGVCYMLVGPITTAVFPSMVKFATTNDQAALKSAYHKGAQLATVLTAPAAMLLVSFAGGVVFMWSGNASLAEQTDPILSILVLGSFLNGLMWMPYQCQLAHGWTSLVLKGNIAGTLVLVPGIFLVVPHFGAVGAAWIWVAVNVAYLLLTIQFMHHRLMPQEKWRWYFGDVLLPLSGTIGVILVARLLRPASYQDRWQWFVFLLVFGCLALAISAMLANHIRPAVVKIFWRRLDDTSGH